MPVFWPLARHRWKQDADVTGPLIRLHRAITNAMRHGKLAFLSPEN